MMLPDDVKPDLGVLLKCELLGDLEECELRLNGEPNLKE